MDNKKVVGIKRKKKKIRFKIISFLFIISVILLLISIFTKVDEFEIYNMNYFNKESILEIAEKQKGDRLIFFFSFFQIDKTISLRSSTLEQDIKSNCSFVKDLKAKYVFPHRFNIYIKERIPAGYLSYYESNLIVDKDCHVISVNNKEVTEKFPLFKGIKVNKFKIGDKVKLKDNSKLDVFKKIIYAVNKLDEKRFINKIKSIDISDKKKIFINFNNGIDCNLGDTYDIDYKINVLEKLIDNYTDSDIKGTYDFTLSKNPIFIKK